MKIVSDAFYYFQGNYRYKLFYSKCLKWVMPKWLRDQICFRISVMDRACYDQGSCKICGCETTAMQMANKPCDKPCYPRMMNARQWALFKYAHKAFEDENGIWQIRNGELKFEENDYRLEKEYN